jgi:hypothetical protein
MISLSVKLIAVITIAFTLLIGGAVALGEVLPPAASFIARNPCDLPCVYGVTPGQTSADQVRLIIEELSGGTFSDSPMDGGSLVFQLERDGISVFGMMALNMPTATLINAISLLPSDPDDLGSLGDLMAAGLHPTHVYRSCDTTIPVMLIAFGEESRVVAEMPLGKRLHPSTPLTFMRVYPEGEDALAESLLSFGCTVELGWRGFAPRAAYLDALLV